MTANDCMELIRISDHKLKIMLTPTDMRQFELNADTFGEDSAEMHRTFRLLLEEIRRQTDFDADDTRISVQYFPSREGGCEMFISRLLPKEDRDCPATVCMQRSLPVPRTVSNGFIRELVYRFTDLQSLLAACKRLEESGYARESRAYCDENGTYYLFLSVCTATPFSIPYELCFLTEYGSIESCGFLKTYLCEHGHEISANGAVHRLAGLA